jgi:CheY-like chemotaxis protein
MLEAEGFHVEEAPDGESALTLVQARAEPFDLVLTDLSMPHIDGRQVSETLARYRPGVALLCKSADPDAVPYIESSDTPVRVLLKPFTPDDLYHAVRDAITRATDLAVVAEAEIVQAHSGLSSRRQLRQVGQRGCRHWISLSPLENCGGLPRRTDARRRAGKK